MVFHRRSMPRLTPMVSIGQRLTLAARVTHMRSPQTTRLTPPEGPGPGRVLHTKATNARTLLLFHPLRDVVDHLFRNPARLVILHGLGLPLALHEEVVQLGIALQPHVLAR